MLPVRTIAHSKSSLARGVFLHICQTLQPCVNPGCADSQYFNPQAVQRNMARLAAHSWQQTALRLKAKLAAAEAAAAAVPAPHSAPAGAPAAVEAAVPSFAPPLPEVSSEQACQSTQSS